MNLKNRLTEYVAKELNLPHDTSSIKQLKPIWWQNPRTKNIGGLRLTEEGFNAFTKASIENHRVSFENRIYNMTNEMIIRLDNYIDCPFYLTRKEIYVFGDKMAVQLILFSGDLEKFTKAKARNIKKHLTEQ